MARELVDQRLDRVRQPLASLVEPRPLRDLRKQVRQARGRDGDEPRVRGDPHDRLGDAERDDLGVGHDSSGVIRLDEQEIARRATRLAQVGRRRRQVAVGPQQLTDLLPVQRVARLQRQQLDQAAGRCAGVTRAPRPGCRRRQRRSARVVRCVVPPGISSPAPWRYNGARHRSAWSQERPAAARHCRVALAPIVGLFIVSRRHAR
jgi:hypothetical protein